MAADRFVPRQRTAVDGKTWWCVFDTEYNKYSTITCFGKYKTKKDCQCAIDRANKMFDFIGGRYEQRKKSRAI